MMRSKGLTQHGLACMQINANDVVIRSNISQGLFTHVAADNWN